MDKRWLEPVFRPWRSGQVILYVNNNTNEYFLTTDHLQICQPNHGEIQGEGWVACTHYYPTYVVPRSEFPDGHLKTAEDVLKLYYGDCKEIPNPDPCFQAHVPGKE